MAESHELDGWPHLTQGSVTEGERAKAVWEEKKAGGGGESAQLHPDLAEQGGAGAWPSAGLTSPLHVCPSHVAPQRGTPELEAPPSPLPFCRKQNPPSPRPSPESWVVGWALETVLGRDSRREERREHALLGQLEGRSSLCNEAGRQGPMGRRPRLLLNENKCSTWARLCSHVSPPQAKALWVPCLEVSPKHPTPPLELHTATEDSPCKIRPVPSNPPARIPHCFPDSLEAG